jgi:hypothetical protein
MEKRRLTSARDEGGMMAGCMWLAQPHPFGLVGQFFCFCPLCLVSEGKCP